MRVKVCGITNKIDAENAIHLGADAIGFIFYEKSSRYISFDDVEDMMSSIPPFVTTVGVFVNESVDVINEVVKRCRLDRVQLHGDEDVDTCLKIHTPIIKAIRVSGVDDVYEIAKYQGLVSGVLLDTKVDDSYGGTGKTFDWGLAIGAQDYDVPVILSGGLNQENIHKALQIVNPNSIDISSGIESEPGKKDYNKMKDFIEIVRSL